MSDAPAASGAHLLCGVNSCAMSSAGFTLGVVFHHRFRKAAEWLTQALRSGELGRIWISSVRAQVPWWRPQGDYDVTGRGTYARDGGGVPISHAIHLLDLMLSLTGPAVQVQSLAASMIAIPGPVPMRRIASSDQSAKAPVETQDKGGAA